MVEKHNYPKKSENLWTVKLEFSGGRDELKDGNGRSYVVMH